MGYFGDLYYSDKQRPFIGLPIEDIKYTTKLLSERYQQARDEYDYLDVVQQNLKTLNDTDAKWVKDRISKTKDGIKSFTTGGDWWNAGGTVKGLFKDFQTDQAVALTQANYASAQEYSKWLDEKGRELGWGEEKLAGYSAGAMRNYTGVQYIDENGNAIEYTDQTKDIGKFAGSFNGYKPGENINLNERLFSLIGDKLGEPDAVFNAGVSNGMPGYFYVTSKTTKFIAEGDVQRMATDLVNTDPKIQQWFNDMDYLNRVSPSIAISDFGTLMETYINNNINSDFKNGRFTAKTEDELSAQVKTRQEELKNNYISGMGINVNDLKTDENGNYINPEVAGKLSYANNNLRKVLAIDDAVNKYAYTQETGTFSLHDDYIYKMNLEAKYEYDMAMLKQTDPFVEYKNINGGDFTEVLKNSKDIDANVANVETALKGFFQEKGIIDPLTNRPMEFTDQRSIDRLITSIENGLASDPNYKLGKDNDLSARFVLDRLNIAKQWQVRKSEMDQYKANAVRSVMEENKINLSKPINIKYNGEIVEVTNQDIENALLGKDKITPNGQKIKGSDLLNDKPKSTFWTEVEDVLYDLGMNLNPGLRLDEIIRGDKGNKAPSIQSELGNFADLIPKAEDNLVNRIRFGVPDSDGNLSFNPILNTLLDPKISAGLGFGLTGLGIGVGATKLMRYQNDELYTNLDAFDKYYDNIRSGTKDYFTANGTQQVSTNSQNMFPVFKSDGTIDYKQSAILSKTVQDYWQQAPYEKFRMKTSKSGTSAYNGINELIDKEGLEGELKFGMAFLTNTKEDRDQNGTPQYAWVIPIQDKNGKQVVAKITTDQLWSTSLEQMDNPYLNPDGVAQMQANSIYSWGKQFGGEYSPSELPGNVTINYGKDKESISDDYFVINGKKYTAFEGLNAMKDAILKDFTK